MQHFDTALQQLITLALQEDIKDGDHSTLSCIPIDQQGAALLKIKDNGMLAGMHVAEQIFKFLEPSASFTPFKKDGDLMEYGETAFEVAASVPTILKAERLVLNCMQRMSGIATLTQQYVQIIKDYPTQLLDTRKTTPNFRLLEKEAVKIGGGINHRFGLYDMIMLKDNHIDYCGGIIKAIDKAAEYSKNLPSPLLIEVEARTLEEVELVCKYAKNKVFRIMLDNFNIPDLLQAIEIIQGNVETEASGGINLNNIQEYAKTGVNYISVGGLIHQARSLDLSLKGKFV